MRVLKLQVSFRTRATNYRALSTKMTYQDKASYGSSPPCTSSFQRMSTSTTFVCVCVCVCVLGSSHKNHKDYTNNNGTVLDEWRRSCHEYTKKTRIQVYFKKRVLIQYLFLFLISVCVLVSPRKNNKDTKKKKGGGWVQAAFWTRTEMPCPGDFYEYMHMHNVHICMCICVFIKIHVDVCVIYVCV